MADFYLRHELILKDAFRDLFKSQKYENYVFEILNRSRTIFKEMNFAVVIDQSCNQPDFVDNYGNKYDAKLLMDTKQGKLIGDRKNELGDWIKSFYEECTEFNPIKSREQGFDLSETMLYRTLKKSIESLEADENGVIFIPFPMGNGFTNSFLSMCSDYLQVAYNKLEEENIVGKRSIYFIYPSEQKNVYVLRDSRLNKEFIEVDDLEEYASFESIIIKR